MVESEIQSVLQSTHPNDIVHHLVKSYRDVEDNFRLEKWKTSELDAGHFVETVRRLIENQLFGAYTAFSTAIGSFNQATLNKYEAATGAEEYRILIPRVLYAMYCIRNKRGVGHISTISPNKLDATLILNSAKWVLAELVRLASATSPDQAEQLVDTILTRQVDLIWDDGETFMVLNKKLRAPDKVLLALYKEDRQTVEALRIKVDYKNKSAFNKIIDELQRDKNIALTTDGICKLSPIGVKAAEALVHTT